MDRIERERGTNDSKIETLKQLTIDFDKEMTDLDPTIDAELESYKNVKDAFNKVETAYQKIVQELDRTHNDRWELQRKLANDRSLFDRTEALVEDKEYVIEDLIEQIESQKIEEKTHNQLLIQLKSDRKEADRNLSTVKKELEKSENNLIELKNRRETISEEKHAVSAQIRSLTGQHEFYNELLESREGFPDGTRFVLENPKSFPGVLGTVADMFQVDEEYREIGRASCRERV